MEEIIINNNQKKTYYLNLFNNDFHDENYFRIGNYELNNDTLKIIYDNNIVNIYKYQQIEDNVKIFKLEKNIEYNKEKHENIIKIIHHDWEDDIILKKDKNEQVALRLSNNDHGTYQLYDDKIIINWLNYDEEVFIYNEDKQHYHIQSPILNVENTKKVVIKNNSWQEECILNLDTLTLVRTQNMDEKGTFIIKNDYLYIKWDHWNHELFYFKNDIYLNNDYFINKLIICLDEYESKTFYWDNMCIYSLEYPEKLLESKQYEYDKSDNKLILKSTHTHIECICIDTIFYNRILFKTIYLNDQHYFIFFKEKLILDPSFIIVGEFIYKLNTDNEKVIEIIFYDTHKKEIYTLLIDDDNNYTLEFKLNNIHDYSHEDIEYVNLISTNENIDNINNINNIDYVENSIHIFKNNQIEKVQLDTCKYLFNEYKDQCVLEDTCNNLELYYKRNTIYFNKREYDYLNNCNFDNEVYDYFNDTYTNLILNIEENKVIYNQYSFEERYVFLNDYTLLKEDMFHKHYKHLNIFKSYGFMFIEKININTNNIDQLNIFNIKVNKELKENQIEIFEKISNHTEYSTHVNIILFDDFSDYEYMSSFIELSTLKNCVLLIDYSKSMYSMDLYIDKLLCHLSYLKNICMDKNIIKNIETPSYKNDKHKQCVYKTMDTLLLNQYLHLLIQNKEDFVLFIIMMHIYHKLN